MWKRYNYFKIISFLFIVTIILTLLLIFYKTNFKKNITSKITKLEIEQDDVIILNKMKNITNLQRIPVIFFHTKHTNTLIKLGYNCNYCHTKFNNHNKEKQTEYTFHKFKNLEIYNNNKKNVTKFYHNECIKCHENLKKLKNKSGPITCGKCHNIKYKDISFKHISMVFDEYLHDKHIELSQEKCNDCHHKINDPLYIENEEETNCYYCHKKDKFNKIMSLTSALHKTCIQCHKNKENSNLKTGPINCYECHNYSKITFKQNNEKISKLNNKQIIYASIIKKVKESKISHDKKDYNTCKTCHHTHINNND